MVCGDLNHILDHTLDTSLLTSQSRKQHLKPQCQALTKLIMEFNLYDTWRALHPTDRQYSHHSQVNKTHSRIDHILSTGPLLRRVLHCEIEDIVWSDHAPNIMSITTQFASRGYAPWRLNESLLQDDTF
ncbi:Hypothetical predicted protein, partial [Pelobates cultripes]